MVPDASIIVPTYNRSQSLARALNSLVDLEYPRDRFEVVVVDNGSTDDTAEVVGRFQHLGIALKYVMERRLSFTLARQAGAAAAGAEILVYIDDDVVVDANWLHAIVEIFRRNPAAGMVSGRIEPIFDESPPSWAVAIQRRFNGWSLWRFSDSECECNGACGPNLAIRKKVLDEVGGFPPDTIGVESSEKPGTVEKIYVGPGDWGLNLKVLQAKHKIIYSPTALVHHVIPHVRMTKSWWRSRIVGEFQMYAFTEQAWRPRGTLGLLLRAAWSAAKGCGGAIIYAIVAVRRAEDRDLWRFASIGSFVKARTEVALARDPGLVKRLWDAALEGVEAERGHRLRASLP